MVHVADANGDIVVRAEHGDFHAGEESQLAFWGFKYDRQAGHFSVPAPPDPTFLTKVVAFLRKSQDTIGLDESIQVELDRHRLAEADLSEAKKLGGAFKNGTAADETLAELTRFLRTGLARPLKDHQVKAALHLLLTRNGANFSVPGSGKTTVVLAAFEQMRQAGEVDALFVVGPPACFGPWRDEYEAVLGRAAACASLAGGDVGVRRSRYRVDARTACDLYLTTFQTLQRDWREVKDMFTHTGLRFFFIIDEAHYIKQLDGAWANAVLHVASSAPRRCVLSGTPFPRDYTDAFNLFDALWPSGGSIPNATRQRLFLCAKQGDHERAIQLMESAVGPLFYRVRKPDLGLAPQIFNPPIEVSMNRYERLAYDLILDQVRNQTQQDFLRDMDLVARLRRGRLMRVRQALSFTPLLATAVTDYEEDLVGNNDSLADAITHYDEIETPGKLQVLESLVTDLLDRGEKVVVWSNFVKSLQRIHGSFAALGIGARMIYGATPIECAELSDELTREGIIREFLDPEGHVNVLIANPAACAESISLHKQCSHAIYYDLSYNCAQYLQSLDRIHRVGGSEDKPSYYYFLQYANTMENDILANVQQKAANMSRIIDLDYPIYSLDMFGDDDELEAYERLFGQA